MYNIALKQVQNGTVKRITVTQKIMVYIVESTEQVEGYLQELGQVKGQL
jgi:hypothetical protein